MVDFSGILGCRLGRRSYEDARQIDRPADINGRFYDYTISPVIRQVLLQWAVNWLKMIYYDFIFALIIIQLLSVEQRLVSRKSKKIDIITVGDKKAAKYYEDNKEVLRENVRNKYRDLPEEEKYITRAYGRDRYRNMTKSLD